MNLIISHAHCPDGMTAAYIAHLRYPEAEILMLDHGMNPPYKEVEDRDVIVLDFSWRTREENIRLSKLAKSFRILDHHKTAEAELAGLDFATFDMNRSGAGLAWDYLFGDDLQRELGIFTFASMGRPWWVNYVEDRDLWRFALPNSKAINAFIMTHEYTLDGWKEMAAASLTEADWYGKAVLLQVNHYVREVLKHAQDGLFLSGDKPYTVKLLNIPYLNCSEVGNELAKQADVSITWFERGDGLVQFSLRSIAPTDVSVIAKQFGGGGHAQAAGFQMRRNEARNFLDGLRNNLV